MKKSFILVMIFAATIHSTELLTFAGSDEGTTAYNAGEHAKIPAELIKAAGQGDASAQLKLGSMFHHGVGVAQNYPEALKWYRKAAEQGLAEAQFNLAAMYGKGQGVPQDSSEEVKWYRKAANRGYTEAQFNMGILYARGEGVPKDYTLAYMWFDLAAAKGHDRARRYRDTAATQLSLDEIAEARRMASEWKPNME